MLGTDRFGNVSDQTRNFPDIRNVSVVLERLFGNAKFGEYEREIV